MNVSYDMPLGFEQVTDGILQQGDWIADIYKMVWEEVKEGNSFIGDGVNTFFCVIRPIKDGKNER